MTEKQKGYIISQKWYDDLEKYFSNHHDDLIRIAWQNMKNDIRPYNPEAIRQDEREKIQKRLIALYETIELHGHYRQILTEADIDCLFAELRQQKG